MMTRTWKCPECGETVEVSYDWLAKNGGLICVCDCDMELQPETMEKPRNEPT